MWQRNDDCERLHLDVLRVAFPGVVFCDDNGGVKCEAIGRTWRLHGAAHGWVHALRMALLADEADGWLTGSDVHRCLGLP